MVKNSTYRWCFVPKCKNTSFKTPNKIFISVPKGELRKTWFESIGRDMSPSTSLTSTIYCCEDHFDLQQDLENFTRVRLDSSANVKLKKGKLPHIFDCQIIEIEEAGAETAKVLINQTNSLQARLAPKIINLDSRTFYNVVKKHKLDPRELVQINQEVKMEVDLEEEEDPLNLSNMSSSESHESFFSICHNHNSRPFQDFVDQVEPIMQESEEEKTITITPLTFKDISNWISEINGTKSQPEVLEEPNPANLMIQSEPFVDNYVPNEIDVSLPVEEEANNFKAHQMLKESRRIPRILKSKTRTSQIPQIVTIPTLQVVNSTSPPPIAPLILRTENLIEVSNIQKISKNIQTDFEDWSKTCVQDKGTQMEDEFFTEGKEQDMSVEALTNLMIVRKPYLYTGLYGNMFSEFTKMIMKHSNESCRDVLMTLMKIRLDDSFRRLEDIFGILEGEAGQIFEKTVSNLASILKDFIFRLDGKATVTTLPIQFRFCCKKFHSVIDYFRVKTHVPGDWRHDNCESIKFLISSTIDGVFNFVSPGYQEEEKDSTVLTSSEYFQKLQEGTTVIANGNFFGIGEMIKQKHCTFIEPDSQEENFSEISAESIASYREKLSLLLESLREFEYIGPKACIPKNALGHLNQVMIIASAIVNSRRRNRVGRNG